MRKLFFTAILATFFLACSGPGEKNAGDQSDDQVIVNTEDSAAIEELNNKATELNVKSEDLNQSLDSLLNEY